MGPTPNYLFPHDYVEGPMLWKRKNTYYVSYGSCCCFCRLGSGNIVLSAPSINGPWTVQQQDTNCAPGSAPPWENTTVCGGYVCHISLCRAPAYACLGLLNRDCCERFHCRFA
jgi:hypothetical protein